MRVKLITLIIALTIFGGAVFGLPDNSNATRSQTADMAALYKSKCARCHGADGKGKPDRTPDFTDPKWQSSRKDEELTQIITDGKGEMPAYGEILSKEQIAGQVTYIRSLAKSGN